MHLRQPLSQLKLVFFTLVFLPLFLLIDCTPAVTAKDTTAFCGIWKREFSPFDPNYHLLQSLKNRGAELGVGPLTFEPLMELFYVERTGIDTAMWCTTGPAAIRARSNSNQAPGSSWSLPPPTVIFNARSTMTGSKPR